MIRLLIEVLVVAVVASLIIYVVRTLLLPSPLAHIIEVITIVVAVLILVILLLQFAGLVTVAAPIVCLPHTFCGPMLR
jgi:hypothetical protein